MPIFNKDLNTILVSLTGSTYNIDGNFFEKNPSAVTFRGHLPVILSEKDKGGLIWQQ